MEKEKSIALLKQNFDRVEMKFEEGAIASLCIDNVSFFQTPQLRLEPDKSDGSLTWKYEAWQLKLYRACFMKAN